MLHIPSGFYTKDITCLTLRDFINSDLGIGFTTAVLFCLISRQNYWNNILLNVAMALCE